MNILITSTTFIPSVLLCGHCQLDYLEKQGRLNYRFCISHFTKAQDIEWADIIIFLRSDSDIDAYVSRIAKKNGIHTVYVLDDDILNAPSYLSSAPYYNLPSTKNNIRTIMANCDTFLTPSPVLKEKYGKSFKYSFLINEPSLNRISEKPENDKVKIGFAGSIDRAQDLNEILEETITKLVEKYEDKIEIEFMGAKPAFCDKLGLKHLPYQDGYDAYTAFMAKCNWDIGLAPMPESEFHRCKYFNKYVEYASFGIVGIYSNVEPYVYGIRDGENGLLVNNNTSEWLNALIKLIEDEKYRKTLSKNCLKEANDKYSLDIISEDYLNKIMTGYEKKKIVKVNSLAFEKSIIFFKRVYRKVAEQGLNFPMWLKKKLDEKFEKYKEAKKDARNLSKTLEIVEANKSVCIFAPVSEDKSSYNKRVIELDEAIDKDIYRIYLSGEDRLCEHLMVDFLDDRKIRIVFNSYDINQCNTVLDIIKKSNNCIIHGVIRFMREKLSSDMLKLFDLEVNLIFDSHGNVPEYYHEEQNYHTEKVTNEIEKVFIDHVNYVLCENEAVLNNFGKKYDGIKDIMILNKDNIRDINRLFR